MTSNTAEKRKYPPMLEQYLCYEEQLPDCLIFMQVGDFYELFFEHAVTASRELNLTLTSRDKNSPDPIPMCGVPVAVVDGYLSRLVDAGHSVAIVSQVGSSNTKGMVERKLERVVTPGIRLLAEAEEVSSEGGVSSLYLSSSGELALCFSAVQSGELILREGIESSQLTSELERLSPHELILPRELDGKRLTRKLGWIQEIGERLPNMKLKFRHFEGLHDASRTGRSFGELKGYAGLSPEAKKAVRILVDYVDEITVDAQVSLREVIVRNYDSVMAIDAVSRRNLELVRNLRDGSDQGTLFQHLNLTQTLGGKRLLREWVLAPLLKQEEISLRQGGVQFFVESPTIREELRELLRAFPDLERIAARIELGIVTARELASMRDALEKLPSVSELLCSDSLLGIPDAVEQTLESLKVPGDLLHSLQSFLVDSPPATLHEGGVIRAGAHEEVDRLRKIRAHGKEWIAELETRERNETGIQSLKIKFNGVLGYFFEVTKANLSKVPERYIRRQSMVSCERFTTEELKSREHELVTAKSKQISLEKELFEEFRRQMKASSGYLRELHQSVSQLDVLAAFGTLAEKENYIRPQLDAEAILLIEDGRHPILAKSLRGHFIPNSISLSSEKGNFIILTGANMGGKSTYLRQSALITIMAQLGSFVPASRAVIGIADKIFARLGASDDIAEGESTFMVEMREAAYIVGNATSRSLVLIDEIGRGTATADGLSIARSILEWIANTIDCRTLFATHFHELTELSEEYPSVENFSVGSVEFNGRVSFTHQIVPGAASKSYGIEVAKLAGLPSGVVERAEYLMKELEERTSSEHANRQLSIFQVPRENIVKKNEALRLSKLKVEKDQELLTQLREKISAIAVEHTTPLEALHLLEELQRLLQ